MTSRQSRYAAARQGKRAKRQTRKLRTYLGRVIRDIERKVSEIPSGLQSLLTIAKRIYQQQTHDAFLVGCGFNLRKLFRFFLTSPLIQANANK